MASEKKKGRGSEQATPYLHCVSARVFAAIKSKNRNFACDDFVEQRFYFSNAGEGIEGAQDS
jgi:hypothetical protein